LQLADGNATPVKGGNSTSMWDLSTTNKKISGKKGQCRHLFSSKSEQGCLAERERVWGRGVGGSEKVCLAAVNKKKSREDPDTSTTLFYS
jgi:hypothetical protein